MPEQKVIDYIKSSLEKGKRTDEIRVKLLSAGWSVEQVDEAFAAIEADRKQLEAQDASNYDFTAREAVKAGWKTFTQNKGRLVGILVIAGLIEVAVQLLFAATTQVDPVLGFLVYIPGFLFLIGIGAGVTKVAIDLQDGAKPGVETLFSQLSKIIPYAGAIFLQMAVVFIGILLLVVPGIIFALKYSFAGYFVVDKNSGPLEAMKRSGEITKGYKLRLLFVGLYIMVIPVVLMILLGTLGVAAGQMDELYAFAVWAMAFPLLVLSFLAAVPVGWMSYAYAYRKLSLKNLSQSNV